MFDFWPSRRSFLIKVLGLSRSDSFSWSRPSFFLGWFFWLAKTFNIGPYFLRSRRIFSSAIELLSITSLKTISTFWWSQGSFSSITVFWFSGEFFIFFLGRAFINPKLSSTHLKTNLSVAPFQKIKIFIKINHTPLPTPTHSPFKNLKPLCNNNINTS